LCQVTSDIRDRYNGINPLEASETRAPFSPFPSQVSLCPACVQYRTVLDRGGFRATLRVAVRFSVFSAASG
jgi:hypothetical protein